MRGSGTKQNYEVANMHQRGCLYCSIKEILCQQLIHVGGKLNTYVSLMREVFSPNKVSSNHAV